MASRSERRLALSTDVIRRASSMGVKVLEAVILHYANKAGKVLASTNLAPSQTHGSSRFPVASVLLFRAVVT